ncbi:MAG: hypothetical protein HXY23_09495 [Parvularculaceae bacterium]|nr:hypothetical protein [Parvularculaceae bacterium]
MNANDLLARLTETTISVSLLIVVILIIRRPIARRFGAEAAYLLWLAPALRILLPEIPAPLAFNASAPDKINVAQMIDASAAAIAGEPVTADPAPLLLALWGGGAAVFLLLQAARQRSFLRRVTTSAAAPSARLSAEAAIAADKAGLKKPVPILVAATETGPLVCGVLRPIVVLPASFETAFTPDERRLALAHEFEHVRRSDLAVALAAILFRALQWPNPLAHAAFARFRADQEATCDAAVMERCGNRPDIAHAYGSAMLKSAACVVSAPAASLSMSHQLKERLMLMKTRMTGRSRLARTIGVALVALGVAASASYSQAGEPQEKRVVVKTSAVKIIAVEGDESIEYDGIKNAKRIEFREEDGVRSVKLFGTGGKLLAEKSYGAGDAAPQAIVIRGKDGKARTVDLDAAPPPPAFAPGPTPPPDAPLPPLPPEGSRADCEAQGGVFAESESKDGAEKRIVTRNCLITRATGDPKSKAEALRATISRLESDESIPADQRAAMMSKLREQLAAAEKEAAGQ